MVYLIDIPFFQMLSSENWDLRVRRPVMRSSDNEVQKQFRNLSKSWDNVQLYAGSKM